MEFKHERFGELLVRNGLISEGQLRDALEQQGVRHKRLGDLLIEDLIATEDQISEALAQQRDLEHVNLSAFQVERVADCLRLLPLSVLEKHLVMPLGFDDEGQLLLAMADPLDVEALDEAALLTGLRIRPLVASASKVKEAITRYGVGAETLRVLDRAALSASEGVADVEAANDVPVVRIVIQLLHEAVLDGASDLHLEPQQDRIRVRHRIDGQLHDVMSLPLSSHPQVVARIKVMADMDITERRRPMDGRIHTEIEGQKLDLRIATTPTPLGENVAIRILNSEIRFHTIDDLGLSVGNLRRLESMLAKPYGAILIAGPTGSGKTTTLYAALNELNHTARKIMTVEDPVEYRVPGVTQIALNPHVDLSFSAGLRAILRSDPDVVMVGEVRDQETAAIAMRAALTGHLMLTSIHTNDAPSALSRLTDMKVERYVTSSALVGVVSQRLVRVLCPHCKRSEFVVPERLEQAGFDGIMPSELRAFSAPGCEACRGTGYSGRIGVFEIMPMDEELIDLFHAGATTERIRAHALAQGMISLRSDALAKVAAGVTSFEELERIMW